MLELQQSGMNTGYCRIYFRNVAPERALNNSVYCLQEEWTKAKAEKTGYNQFVLYRCSKDGEPQYEIDLDMVRKIQFPTGEADIEKSLSEYLTNQGKEQL